mmetsp:Transcript_57546/g.95327  ORF Transcript_57546/g.95327 Transcript_57546/m.95327 type:complete len:488 (-) Transcript_57546:338-1801(-)
MGLAPTAPCNANGEGIVTSKMQIRASAVDPLATLIVFKGHYSVAELLCKSHRRMLDNLSNRQEASKLLQGFRQCATWLLQCNFGLLWIPKVSFVPRPQTALIAKGGGGKKDHNILLYPKYSAVDKEGGRKRNIGLLFWSRHFHGQLAAISSESCIDVGTECCWVAGSGDMALSQQYCKCNDVEKPMATDGLGHLQRMRVLPLQCGWGGIPSGSHNSLFNGNGIPDKARVAGLFAFCCGIPPVLLLLYEVTARHTQRICCIDRLSDSHITLSVSRTHQQYTDPTPGAIRTFFKIPYSFLGARVTSPTGGDGIFAVYLLSFDARPTTGACSTLLLGRSCGQHQPFIFRADVSLFTEQRMLAVTKQLISSPGLWSTGTTCRVALPSRSAAETAEGIAWRFAGSITSPHPFQFGSISSEWGCRKVSLHVITASPFGGGTLLSLSVTTRLFILFWFSPPCTNFLSLAYAVVAPSTVYTQIQVRHSALRTSRT